MKIINANIKIHFIIIIFLLCFVGIVSKSCDNKCILEIDEKESYYSDFWIEGENVYIRCKLVVKNSSKKEQFVEFYADFPYDKKYGLINYSKIKGFDNKLEKSEFNIPVGKNRIEVVFMGEFAGNNKKYDRNLPNIDIVPCN